MQIINTTNFDDFVKNATIRFRKSFDDFPKRASALYDVENTQVIEGEDSSLDGFSVAKIKRDGEDFAYLDINQGYNKTWSIYEVGGMTKITWKMRVGNKYRVMNKKISNLGRSAAKRMEWDMTHRLTFAWSTTYTNLDGDSVNISVGDTLALMYTAHTITGGSGTYRNCVANNPILSKGGIEAAEKLFVTQMIDNNGELISIEPDTLIISNDPTTKNTALEYLRSKAAPDAGNAGVYNVLQEKYKLLVLPYLATTAAGAYDSDKAGYWFLASLMDTDGVVKVLANPTLIPPTINDGKEFETMDWKFASHAAYEIYIVRPNWIVGSKGDGSA